MYIALRTGGGRGVYEMAGTTATGLRPAELIGRRFVLEFGDGLTVPLDVVLTDQGGKPRFTRTGNGIQIQRQIAALLMLPSPRRDRHKWSEEYRVPVRQAYVIDQVQLEFVDHARSAMEARVVPDVVRLTNAGGEWFIQVDDRMREVEYLWSHASLLSAELRSLIARHQELATSGLAIPQECESIVASIVKAIGQAIDPLPALMSMVNQNGKALYRDGNERAWKQIVQRRGQGPFRNSLIAAYGQNCQVTAFTGVEALEAAHIVPYSPGRTQSNDPTNGLLLRADIHTLFDLALLKVDPDTLRVRIMEPLLETSYMKYHDTDLRTSDHLRPAQEALAAKWNQDFHAI